MSNEANGTRDGVTACFVCGAAVGDHWFGRLRQASGLIHVCSPRCGILYVEASPVQSELPDRVQYYRDQEQRIREAKSVTGELYSYDARMGGAAY